MHLHCPKASPTFISETSALAKGNASALPDKTRKHETAFFTQCCTTALTEFNLPLLDLLKLQRGLSNGSGLLGERVEPAIVFILCLCLYLLDSQKE